MFRYLGEKRSITPYGRRTTKVAIIFTDTVRFKGLPILKLYSISGSDLKVFCTVGKVLVGV